MKSNGKNVKCWDCWFMIYGDLIIISVENIIEYYNVYSTRKRSHKTLHFIKRIHFHNFLRIYLMDHSGYAPSHYETALPCNAVSHWLGPYREWFPLYFANPQLMPSVLHNVLWYQMGNHVTGFFPLNLTFPGDWLWTTGLSFWSVGVYRVICTKRLTTVLWVRY